MALRGSSMTSMPSTADSASVFGVNSCLGYVDRPHCLGLYDARACLYDTDRAPETKKYIRKARQLGVQEIKSTPCIEGLHLEIVEEKVPASSEDCKNEHCNASSATTASPKSPLFRSISP